MQYQDPDDRPIENLKEKLPIVQEEAGAIVPLSPSPLSSLDVLIAQERSAEKIRELLELKDIALRQKWQEKQMEEAQRQQEYERLTQDKKERTITIASSGTIAIGLGIMYSTSLLVGTFVLLLGLATLLRIPFDELYDEFLEFSDKIYERLSSIFPPKL
ncbi:MAG: hypothetical protein J0L70_21365 [Leptolyngbya sp. UWPOB_LEPTO1]|uniref:hypothetical protein n=1 Tax=Leptolyngbya sp. UWPOB_LEPTO1 TaxID=2815653 RepID=UPI001AC8363F|nr:hypothetical protein [Leptolyngbya sp. UWPOB_LEPTO1]MBN8563089.1 hypothetical protein [Leptolyngbya sp. UWPOB_LEPTO1]